MTFETIGGTVATLGVFTAMLLAVFALVFSLAVAAGRAYLERWARQSFDRELSAHRAQLQAQTEALRLEHQRKLQDFSIYTQQRHRAYAETYRLLLESEAAITNMREDGWKVRSFDEYAVEQVQELIRTYDIDTAWAQSHVLRDWEVVNSRGRGLLKHAVLEKLEARASAALDAFRAAHLSNSLFFSDEVRRLLQTAYTEAGKYFRVAADHVGTEKVYRLQLDLSKGTLSAADGVRKAMQRELQRGDYASVAPDSSAGSATAE